MSDSAVVSRRRVLRVGAGTRALAWWGLVCSPLLLGGCRGAPSQLSVATCSIEQKDFPPYVIAKSGGEVLGFEIDLWKGVYDKMADTAASSGNAALQALVGNERPALLSLSRPEIIQALMDGTVDIAFCALYVQDVPVDFAPGHLLTGLQAVVKSDSSKIDFWDILSRIFVPFQNVFAQSALLLILYFAIVVAHIIWFLERETNPAQFNPAYGPGIIDALWYAMVTALTIGYGDKVASSVLSKLVAIVWMVIGAYFVGIFGAALTSGFIVSQLDSSIAIQITSFADMAQFSVGVLSVNTESIVRETVRSADITLYASDAELLTAVVDGGIQIAISDQRAAKYAAVVDDRFKQKVVPTWQVFREQQCAFGVRKVAGGFHPVYALLRDAVTEYTRGNGRESFQVLKEAWFGDEAFVQTTENQALEDALASSNLIGMIVLVVIAVLWAFSVALHYRDEIREEMVRGRFMRELNLGKKYTLLELRKGAAALFDKIDRDKSGTLDVLEIMTMLKSMGKDVDFEDISHYIDREVEARVASGITPRRDLAVGPEPTSNDDVESLEVQPMEDADHDSHTNNPLSLGLGQFMTNAIAPLASMVGGGDRDLEKQKTLIVKEEFIRIIEGLIMDEEDDMNDGNLDPHAPAMQKHVLHMGGEIQKQVQEAHDNMSATHKHTHEEIAAINAKLDMILEALQVPPERVRAAVARAQDIVPVEKTLTRSSTRSKGSFSASASRAGSRPNLERGMSKPARSASKRKVGHAW